MEEEKKKTTAKKTATKKAPAKKSTTTKTTAKKAPVKKAEPKVEKIEKEEVKSTSLEKKPEVKVEPFEMKFNKLISTLFIITAIIWTLNAILCFVKESIFLGFTYICIGLTFLLISTQFKD